MEETTKKEVVKGFRITQGRGFMIDLPNGVTFSTQFGAGNYCHNRDAYDYYQKAPDDLASQTAEIAAWISDTDTGLLQRTWITKELRHIVNGTTPDDEDEWEDDVEGWITVKNWLRWLDAARIYKAKGVQK